MSTSKEYKAVRNCILNELHLTKEDIIKNIEPLWIYLASGTLHVMMHGDTNYNPTPEFTQYGGSNIENSVTIIDGILNDGGDW